jgi:hypothetical protein
MANTRGNLAAARITLAGDNITIVRSDHPTSIECMFNPFEYTISKSNSFSEEPKNDSDTPQGEFKKAGSQTLELKLVFDTYEEGKDVSEITNKLWAFMRTDVFYQKTSESGKKSPPQVAFEWGGVFRFVSYIVSMTQKFTLFLKDGTPVRAEVTVKFTQYTDVNDYPKQNPSSGGGPTERIRQVVAGDRLDWIAAQEYADASQWRLIAEHNRIANPLALKPGMRLRIPAK